MEQELEQLRSQYNDLKARLDEQEIINSRLIRESIRKGLDYVQRKKWLSLAVALIVIPNIYFLAEECGFRPLFTVVSIVFITAMTVVNFICDGKNDVRELAGDNVKDFLRKVKQRKKSQFRRVQIFYPLAIVWAGYFVGECIHAGMEPMVTVCMIAGIVVGLLVGSIWGFSMHNRIIGIYEGIILELEHPEASGKYIA